MDTRDDLSTAMNDLALSTEPLDGTTVLRAAKRYRSRRRLLAGGGVMAAVLGITLVIGSLHGAAGSKQTAGAGDATQQLRESLAGIRTGNYTFSRTGDVMVGDISDGMVHMPDSFLLKYPQGGISIMRVGAAAYFYYGADRFAGMKDYLLQHSANDTQRKRIQQSFAPLDGQHWARADLKRLGAAAAVDQLSSLDTIGAMPTAEHPDVTGADVLIDAVVTASRSGDVITGTLDGTKVDDHLLVPNGNNLAGPYGPESMPYRATLDSQGRLTALTVTVGDPQPSPAAGPSGGPAQAAVVTITISQYGQTPAPTAPTTTLTLNTDAYDALSIDID